MKTHCYNCGKFCKENEIFCKDCLETEHLKLENASLNKVIYYLKNKIKALFAGLAITVCFITYLLVMLNK